MTATLWTADFSHVKVNYEQKRNFERYGKKGQGDF